MREITFKNGKTLKVEQYIIDTLFDKVTNKSPTINAVNWFETFKKTQVDPIYLIININEIAFVK